MNGFGNLGVISPSVIRGWAVIEDSTNVPEIVISIDGDELCTVKACIFRKDLLNAKIHPTGNCGFEVKDFNHIALKKGNIVRAFIRQTGTELNNSPYYLKGKISDLKQENRLKNAQITAFGQEKLHAALHPSYQYDF